MSEEKPTGNKRTLNWNFILYPESAPENWRDIIDETRIEWVESPLHDKDINEDGTEKKHHHHITLLFPSVKTYDQIEELTKSVNAPIPIKCMSVKGSIRYMVHKDNPEKHQYDWDKIVTHGGADLSSLCAPTATERIQIQKDILDFIRDNDIIEFCDLIDSITKINNDDWLNVAINFSTISINAYIKSRRHKSDRIIKPAVSNEMKNANKEAENRAMQQHIKMLEESADDFVKYFENADRNIEKKPQYLQDSNPEDYII